MPSAPRSPDRGAGVQVRRSRRRRRSVTAYRNGDVVVVAIPARFTAAQEREWVDRMVARLEAQERRRRPSDAALAHRAETLSDRYLGGLARPSGVRWAANLTTRWGSCTPADATIRVSTRLRGVPAWVLDYVLLHELAHLLEARHGPAFWALLADYPRTERARGFLEGLDSAAALDTSSPAPTTDPAPRDPDSADPDTADPATGD